MWGSPISPRVRAFAHPRRGIARKNVLQLAPSRSGGDDFGGLIVVMMEAALVLPPSAGSAHNAKQRAIHHPGVP